MNMNETKFVADASQAIEANDKALRETAFKKFQVSRLSIAAGDGNAASKVAESLRALFSDSGVLEELVRTAFTVNYEGMGRAFFGVTQDVMFTDASIEAARELGMLNVPHAPLDMRRQAAIESLGSAISELGL